MTHQTQTEEKLDERPTSQELDVNQLSKTETSIEGTTQLYDGGKIRFIPMPTADPKDPLNFSTAKKFLIIGTVCFFGAVALATQQILGSLLPIFVLQYAGVDPKILNSGIPTVGLKSVNPNPLSALAMIPGAPPLWRVNLLSSLPLLIVGLSNYFLVPASIIFGRRPVLIVCGALAWTCAIWAGRSQSLNSHLAARCVQALGAGAVESLIPLVVTDMTFINQRNRGIGIVWASQAAVTLSLGIGSNYIVSRLSWRWLYYILAIITAVSWIMIIFLVPETRWMRSSAELRGETSTPLPAGKLRPNIDPYLNGKGTMRTNLKVFQGGIHWGAGKIAILETIKSLISPNVVVIVLLNAVFIGVSLAASQAMTPVLLALPYSWPFDHVGLSVIAIVISNIFVYIVGGLGADRIANHITKRQQGRREPEVHLWSLMIPVFFGILGCILYGIGGQYSNEVSWATLLIGTAMLNFGFLSTNIIGSVYCIESFPEWAGPVLVNVASFRNVLGFAFSFGVTDWIEARGYLGCFGIYAGCLALLSLGIPFLLIFGKRIRRSVGRLVKRMDHSG
ncbi:MFS general substrate transporter [Stipitochalara longipes BDJ]|nr:MFS general substrate transporter [Stipitochalara longipes BDJ]